MFQVFTVQTGNNEQYSSKEVLNCLSNGYSPPTKKTMSSQGARKIDPFLYYSVHENRMNTLLGKHENSRSTTTATNVTVRKSKCHLCCIDANAASMTIHCKTQLSFELHPDIFMSEIMEDASIGGDAL